MISRLKSLLATVGVALVFFAAGPAMANPCNPCGPENACNPCGEAMNACNPCGEAMNACNPCAGAMNACNPCAGANMAPVDPAKFQKPKGAVLAKGKSKKGLKLWSDKSISGGGDTSCSTCHPAVGDGPYAMMNESFAKNYPHNVKMAEERAGVEEVTAAEMVNFCMLVPMKGEPLAWESKELADLAAYVESVQDDYQPVAGMKNACNPCGGMKNACNPCAGMKNACNPCGH